MKNCYYKDLALLLAALLVTPVVAYDNETEIYEEFYRFEKFQSHDTHYKSMGVSLTRLSISNIENYVSIQTVFFRPFANAEKWVEVADPTKITGIEPVTLRYKSTSGPIIAKGTVSYYHGDTPSKSHVRLDLDTWYSDVVGTDTGPKNLYIELPASTNLRAIGTKGGTMSPGRLLCFGGTEMIAGYYQVEYTASFQHKLTLTEASSDTYRITYFREFVKKHDSIVTITDRYGNVTGPYHDSVTKSTLRDKNLSPFMVDVESTEFGEVYRAYLGPGEFTFDPDPDPVPGDETLRRGSVTMTDHNGTSISGFKVIAVNHYTGQSYSVSTDTDVAVITLPMDQTTEIRNPQTGVYEEAPVGYYRFYGQKPGYKMLNEEGIKVSVMPEKYGSYKLCDILVSSDTGPLTGKHQFQLRSWSDNSILQTGTISAKSRTTGIWYNATVVNGLATLILSYDTSDAISEHAGHYYVYATSPGYEDNDYGLQIPVYPHTVSEVKWIHLTPIGGVPTPGNVTLRIQAISETGPGVVNAEIFIAGVLGAGASVWDTYTASSTGYLTVSVPGNSTYDIVASGAGYDSARRRIQVFDDDPGLIEMRLYLSGAPTVEPPTEPTGWPTGPPPTQPPGGIPDDDDDSDGFLMQAVRGIGLAFGVGFTTAKIIFGMLLALSIGFATAKQLRGGAAEFGIGLLGGTMLGVLIGLLPVWIIVVLLLVVGLYIGNRYVGGANNG